MEFEYGCFYERVSKSVLKGSRIQLFEKAWEKYIQRAILLATLSQFETISNKKRVWGNFLYDLLFTVWGDRIPTYGLVLPKHQPPVWDIIR